MSKLVETAEFNQIHGHLVSNIFYLVAQSGYRGNHRTETALLKVMKDILWTNYGQAARYYSCIAWSQCCFRYRWSQHSPRQIIVKTWFERHVLPLTGSDLISLAVPSDSLFGELYLISLTCALVFLKARVLTPFFTVYASALFGDVEKHLPAVHCYADDFQLYISFSSKGHSGHRLIRLLL